MARVLCGILQHYQTKNEVHINGFGPSKKLPLVWSVKLKLFLCLGN
jgi:hypothetical protein